MRTIIIVIFLALYVILTLPILLAIVIVGLFNKKSQYKMTKVLVSHLTKGIMFLAGSKITINGLEYIPDETVLFVGNHRSIFDIVLLMYVIKRPFGFIGKKEVTKIPYVNLVLSLLGGLFLDRQDPRKALKTILEGIELLKSGHSMLIFPEGTRNKVSEEPLPFKQGSLKLAEKANAPVVPFSIKGTDNIFNKGLNIKACKVNLNFGEPVILSELSPEEKKKSAVHIRSIIEQLLSQE